MILPGLARLAGFLDAREGLPPYPPALLKQPSGQVPPSPALPDLEDALAQLQAQFEAAQTRSSRAHARLQRLRALPVQLQPGLEALSGLERAQIQELADQEAVQATKVSERLSGFRERLCEEIKLARVLREAAIARYQARSELRERGPRLAVVGPQAPLGRLAQAALIEAIQQVHDQVLIQEMADPERSSEAWWPLKDDLDRLQEEARALENAPLPKGWQVMAQVIGELERIHQAANAER